jgi:hypothetical protein
MVKFSKNQGLEVCTIDTDGGKLLELKLQQS